MSNDGKMGVARGDTCYNCRHRTFVEVGESMIASTLAPTCNFRTSAVNGASWLQDEQEEWCRSFGPSLELWKRSPAPAILATAAVGSTRNLAARVGAPPMPDLWERHAQMRSERGVENAEDCFSSVGTVLEL